MWDYWEIKVKLLRNIFFERNEELFTQTNRIKFNTGTIAVPLNLPETIKENNYNITGYYRLLENFQEYCKYCSFSFFFNCLESISFWAIILRNIFVF